MTDEEKLEAARDRIHAPGATARDVKEFRRLSKVVADARVASRQAEEAAGTRGLPSSAGDAAPTPDTVKAKGRVR